MSTANTITLKGDPTIDEQLTAAEALSPGHLIELASATQHQKHSTAGGNAARVLALEQAENGRTVSDAYAIGDTVKAGHFRPGDRAQMRVAVGTAAIAAGAFLESVGDGTVRTHAPQAVDEGGTATFNVIPSPIVGRAREAVDNSAGSAEVFIDVEVM